MGVATLEEQANIAYLDSVRIPIRESYETETLKVQDEVHEVILPFLEGNPNDFTLNAHGIPKLQREKHAPLLKKMISDYPSQYAALDASRPWMVYWSLQSMTALGQDIHPYQKRSVQFSHISFRNPLRSIKQCGVYTLVLSADRFQGSTHFLTRSAPNRWTWRRLWTTASFSMHVCRCPLPCHSRWYSYLRLHQPQNHVEFPREDEAS
jgi:hypothetical protein